MLMFNPELFDFSITNEDERFFDLFRRHYHNITTFFTEHKAKFIQFDLENPDLSELNFYIDTQDLTFPHENHNTRDPLKKSWSSDGRLQINPTKKF